MGLLSNVTTHVSEELTKETNKQTNKTPTNLSNLCTESVFSHPASISLRKAFLQCWHIWRFSGMDPLVLQEVGPTFEGLSTLEAPVRGLPCVDDGVLQKVGAPVEGLPTLHALVWLLPCVDPLVL